MFGGETTTIKVIYYDAPTRTVSRNHLRIQYNAEIIVEYNTVVEL